MKEFANAINAVTSLWQKQNMHLIAFIYCFQGRNYILIKIVVSKLFKNYKFKPLCLPVYILHGQNVFSIPQYPVPPSCCYVHTSC